MARFRRTRKPQLRAYGILTFSDSGEPLAFLPPGETTSVQLLTREDLQQYERAGVVHPDDLDRARRWL